MANTDDLKTHQETWHNFIRLLLYSAGAIAVALILMAIFLL